MLQPLSSKTVSLLSNVKVFLVVVVVLDYYDLVVIQLAFEGL
jgi:hypothetical protein